MASRTHRSQLHIVADSATWLLALPAAYLLQERTIRSRDVGWIAVATLSALAVYWLAAWGIGLYQTRWRYASHDEFAAVSSCVGVAAVCAAAEAVVPSFRGERVSVAIVGSTLVLVGLAAMRYLGYRLRGYALRPAESARPILIYGAGSAGTQLVYGLQGSPGSKYRVVGLLDDDPGKRRLTIAGVRVLGGLASLGDAKEKTGAETLVLAMPSAGGEQIRAVIEAAAEHGLTVRTVPSLNELFEGRVDPSSIRAVTEADLLGRRQIDTDLGAIAGYLTGKRVLVTGAGGSIGSELCRQLSTFEPAELMMLDRDESALHALQLSMEGTALLESEDLIVADIRDAERLHEIFERRRPEVVFHAAALKHLPLLELHPEEGVKSNVWGTRNVLDASVRAGVERFVNISTDKAANPTSVLGYTKRVAERFTAHRAAETGLPYLSVRFGNVLGSRGSVVPAFKAMIERGGPVTVTDPEVTRFFMTIPEAVQLVIQAAAIGEPGEVLILDMGQPIRIVDVARRLIEASGKDIEIRFTGLRPGEKLHEELMREGEIGVQRSHPLITHASAPAYAPDDAARYLAGGPTALIELARSSEPNEPRTAVVLDGDFERTLTRLL
ncbi:MAG: polysaccharide biosynthesis protein [Acidimicrobiales bacterium]|nr:polysaccharide biosynthesis protein [Acidimicrobiales bacterium]